MEDGECILPSSHLRDSLVSSEAKSAPEEAKTARLEAALAITTPNELVEEGELPEATETHGSLNLEAP